LDPVRLTSFRFPDSREAGFEPARSEVVRQSSLDALPLSGRDAYALLVAASGIGSDGDTARGLGLAAEGQRPSATSFLLDGAENNNTLVTGPLTILPPEALQEYRISTSNFSAEFGRTGGVVANAVTRRGGNAWHGLAWLYAKNEVLNANGFQSNRSGLPRTPDRQRQTGLQAGGPLRANRSFVTATVEQLWRRTYDAPQEIRMPTSSFRDYTRAGGAARSLMERFGQNLPNSRNPTERVIVRPSLSLDRWLGLARFDQHWRNGLDRLTFRVMVSDLKRPDFDWTPYPEFQTPFQQRTDSYLLAASTSLSESMVSNTVLSFSRDDLRWDRQHPEIPTLLAQDGTVLPGSLTLASYRNRPRVWEVSQQISWPRMGHFWRFGGSLQSRRLDGHNAAGRDGRYTFPTYVQFGADLPAGVEQYVSRRVLPNLVAPDHERRIVNRQATLFVQDAWRPLSSLALHYGARWESFGVPTSIGAQDQGLIRLGPGASLAARVASAQMVFPESSRTDLYHADNNNFAARFGWSWRMDSTTFVRGSYGVFYDRPFDNLWQNMWLNGAVVARAALSTIGLDFLQPVSDVLNRNSSNVRLDSFPEPVFYQPGIRDAYVHHYFAGIRHHLSTEAAVDLDWSGALGRKLLATDKINRPYSGDFTTSNPLGRWNGALPTISYRGNQGLSNYQALNVKLRYSSPSLESQVTYSWSHAIDNQSDPLSGDFFDLRYTRTNYAGDPLVNAAFSHQLDSRGDRGNSEFDQRHNLVFWSIWHVPERGTGPLRGLLRGWRLAQLAAFRSGLPFTVFAPAYGGFDYLYNPRADWTGRQPVVDTAAEGCECILKSRFGAREPGTQLFRRTVVFQC
jgi:hypothetical protein